MNKAASPKPALLVSYVVRRNENESLCGQLCTPKNILIWGFVLFSTVNALRL